VLLEVEVRDEVETKGVCMPVTDPPGGEPSDATGGPVPESADVEMEPESVDDDNDPQSSSQKRKMKAALDDFVRPTRLKRSGLRR
jgi:hypothetical protein